jgi:hypothetical protein
LCQVTHPIIRRNQHISLCKRLRILATLSRQSEGLTEPFNVIQDDSKISERRMMRYRRNRGYTDSGKTDVLGIFVYVHFV